MGFNYNFHTIGDVRDIKDAMGFLRLRNEGYKGYDRWTQKCKAEMEDGTKQAIVVRSYGVVVGDLVYQHHKELVGVLEIKNFRIHKDFRRSWMATFMLKQLEKIAKEGGYSAIMVDARKSRKDIVGLFTSAGYEIAASVCIYDTNNEDVAMVKSISRKDGLGLVDVVGRHIIANSL